MSVRGPLIRNTERSCIDARALASADDGRHPIGRQNVDCPERAMVVLVEVLRRQPEGGKARVALADLIEVDGRDPELAHADADFGALREDFAVVARARE